jgi:hypothetical protein
MNKELFTTEAAGGAADVERVVRHDCSPAYAEARENIDGYGEAITSCYENEKGEFWAGNDEYGSRVNYCPFCGMKAPRQIDS